MSLTCQHCGKEFTHAGMFKRHLEMHKRKRQAPPTAPVFTKKQKLDKPPESADFRVQLRHRGFGDLLQIYRVTFKSVQNDIAVVGTMLCLHLCYLLERAVLQKDGIKAQLRFTVKFYKAVDPKTTIQAYFASKPTTLLHTSDFEHQYRLLVANIHTNIQDFTRRGSGWVVERIEHVDLYVSLYRPIRGKSYSKLPSELASKKAIFNVKNKDNKCFMWSVLAALKPAEKDPQRIAKYKQCTNQLDFTGIDFPVALMDIPKFEQQNNIGINVLGYGDEGLYPLHNYTVVGGDIINLLLLTPKDSPGHYCWIKDLGKLLFTATKYEHKKHICTRCLCPFNTAERLQQHEEFCTAQQQRAEMPAEKDLKLKFRNVHKQLRAPYTLYADAESFIEDQGEDKQHHEPNSYGLLGVKRCCQDRPEFETPVIYRGHEPIKHFLNTLLEKGDAYIRTLNVPMIITPQDQASFDTAKGCYLCRKPLHGEKHRDHCHVCGKYRGPLHPGCNLTAKVSKDVTVMFHNLRGYDGHLIMQKIGTLLQERDLKLECVAKGMEDYMSFVVRLKTGNVSWRLRFIDSCAHLKAPLATLVKNVPQHKLYALRRFTKHPDLLCQKGYYPYNKVTGPEIFNYPGLLPIADFHNRLTKQGLTPAQYEHALHVYIIHNFANFGQYHDLYLLTDVLLLADIFENFRDTALATYGLDPVHYITLPSFSWDALLKYTGVTQQLLDDPNMYLFFTAGIRGGISVITHRYARANNPLLSDYDPNEDKSFIQYLDANNLYGWAMSQKLPVSDFEWVGEMQEMPPTDEYGYVLEVDLEYPAHLHDAHNDYPLAAEKIVPPYLSKYCGDLRDKLCTSDVECKKLIPNLMDKTKYIIHHKALRQCLELGLKLKRIHGGIKFKESAWMKPYIDFNTRMRAITTDDFEKDLFKLKNNAVFGKSMENVFNYVTVKLTLDPEQYLKLIKNPRYGGTQEFDNGLHAVLLKREKVTLNKPIYTGYSVLELSKTLMYSFHYGYILKKYGPKARLLFTDTDSLCYKVRTDDICKDMLADQEKWFDTSNYPRDHELHSDQNKKMIGYMKDETAGVPIKEFVGLRSKMYSILLEQDEMKRAKGINKAVVEKEISREDYKDTLFLDRKMRHKVTQFRSSSHHIYTVENNKVSLSAYDDKRYILENGVESLAYGHKDIDAAANPLMMS